jgi:hypothetical protein
MKKYTLEEKKVISCFLKEQMLMLEMSQKEEVRNLMIETLKENKPELEGNEQHFFDFSGQTITTMRSYMKHLYWNINK